MKPNHKKALSINSSTAMNSIQSSTVYLTSSYHDSAQKTTSVAKSTANLRFKDLKVAKKVRNKNSTQDSDSDDQKKLDLTPYYKSVFQYLKSTKNANIYKTNIAQAIQKEKVSNRKARSLTPMKQKSLLNGGNEKEGGESRKGSEHFQQHQQSQINYEQICKQIEDKTQETIKNTTQKFLESQEKKKYRFEFQSSKKLRKCRDGLSIKKQKKLKQKKHFSQFEELVVASKHELSAENEQKKWAQLEQMDEKLGLLRNPIVANKEQFSEYYRAEGKMEEYQAMLELNENIYSSMNRHISEYFLLPRKLNLINGKDQNFKFKANNVFGSNDYVDLFSKGISTDNFKQLRKLELRNNSIDCTKLNKLTVKLPSSLQYLDLSKNKIDKKAMELIDQSLKSRNRTMQWLNLESNQIGDWGAQVILEGMVENKFLSKLSLSRNQISDRPAQQLYTLLRKSCSLRELYLSFNQITHQGGALIFKGVLRNEYIKVLDLSFNRLGFHEKNECLQAIVNVLVKPHAELIHLDLSYNSFGEQDAQKIADNLVFNQVLYGFHFEGNAHSQWVVNAKGYLAKRVGHSNSNSSPALKAQEGQLSSLDLDTEEYQKKELLDKIKAVEWKFEKEESAKFYRSIEGVNCLEPRKEFRLEQGDCCWICDGWQEVSFTWTPQVSGKFESGPIFVHLDFEGYKPTMMQRQVNSTFVCRRMCPPNSVVHYFFSNPIEFEQVCALDQKTTKLSNQQIFETQAYQFTFADGTVLDAQLMRIVNFMKTKARASMVDASKHYLPLVQVKPREPEVVYDIDPTLAKKRHWSIECSFFQNFQPDSQGHLQECFEFDISCSRFLKFFKRAVIDQLKDKLKVVYGNILACYKYYASISLHYDFPIVNSLSFQEFVSQTKIMQRKIISQIDYDLIYSSAQAVANRTNWLNLHDKALVRFQFLEIIIRLANDQYLKTGHAKDLADAVHRIFQEDGVLHWLSNFGVAQQWREQRYWNQLLDMAIKHKMPLLKQLYDDAAKLTIKRGKYVSAQDFLHFFASAALVPAHLSEQELYFIFLQSMMSQVDELTDTRFMQMTFVEFVEGIARVAEKVSPSSPMYSIKNQDITKRRVLPLLVKFEGMLYILFHRIKLSKVNFSKSILTETILKSNQARRLGIYDESESENSESSGESEKQDEVMQIQDPEQLIQKQLLYEAAGKEQRRMTVDINVLKAGKVGALKALAKRHELKQELQNFNSANIIQKLQQESEKAEILEQEELEESSPLTKQNLLKQRLKRKQMEKGLLQRQQSYVYESKG